MRDFQPYFTNDGSVGLYSSNFDDIYHSASGALTEAYEKFIYPINWDQLLLNEEIKILDICYGIGYNTKSFLNFIFENKKKLLKQKKFLINNFSAEGIVSIHTNKNINQDIQIYNDKIHTNNIFNNLSVTVIDNDNFLCGLSPFIKTGVKKFKNNNEFISKLEIGKYFVKNKNFPEINNLINYQILLKLAQKYPKILKDADIIAILASAEFKDYFNNVIKHICSILLINKKIFNLHNIYYMYLSLCYKIGLKLFKLQDFNLNVKIKDARSAIREDKNIYNLIFLDAFTPSKCPCLWSYDFFKELYNHLTQDGMLLTYSSSAKVRSAMIEAGFYIGNIYNKRLNKYQGTVATKNSALIKYELSEVDFGLLKTKAGIFYRDKNLTASNEAIMAENKNEAEMSPRISSSQYIKLRGNNEV